MQKRMNDGQANATMLSAPETVLAELHRVLREDGTLSLLDPHMRREDLIAGVTQGRSFELADASRRTYRFVKQ